MHRGYLMTLPRKFMRGMAGFDPNFPGTYHILRSTVEPQQSCYLLFGAP